MTRRGFLSSVAAGLALGVPRLVAGGERLASSTSFNGSIRIGIVGLGGIDIVGGVGGRGRQLIDKLRRIPDAKIVALCDVDQTILDASVRSFKDRGESVTAYTDLRKLLEDDSVDAVVVATPNHWHALATVWACQAGKDAYVEKPFSHDLWEGRQMVAAAKQYGRIVQVGTQNRSSALLKQAFDDLRGGALGQIRFAHAIVYRPRAGIRKVDSPTPPPPTVNYDLWCGPAPMSPLMRTQLHYEWHWFWDTGNGEMGNNGVHVIDICRWGLDQNQLPRRALSIGGRFSTDDHAETPNTQIAFLDYSPAPIICEVRNVRAGTEPDAIGKFRNASGGIIIDCEGGYLAGDSSRAALFDYQGKKIRDIQSPAKGSDIEIAHLTNFLNAVRSRKGGELAADATQGHLSAGCCHMANVSHRLGHSVSPEVIQEAARADKELSDAFDRCREYLMKNGVDLTSTPAVLGAWANLDPAREQFVGDLADRANALSRREYREGFAVPEIV